MSGPSYLVVEQTSNQKTGPISVTHAAQSTCPSTCPLQNAGCYAERGNQRWVTARVNNAQREWPTTADGIAELEARGIHKLTGERKLRVHIVGDVRTASGAMAIGSAMSAHEKKHGKLAWTYTHAWRHIDRHDWGPHTRVLASCHSAAEVLEARRMGYTAATITTPKHKGDRPRVYEFDRLQIIPCPAQYHHADGSRFLTCATCKICQDVDMLARTGRVVGFEPDQQTDKRMKVVGQDAGADWNSLPFEEHQL